MRKYLFYTLALVGCWLLPLGVHTLVSIFYEKNFTYTIIHGVPFLSIISMEKRTIFCTLWITFPRDITAFPLSPFENFTYMG